VDQLVVLDGDDTLWFVEPLYDEARSKAAAIIEKAQLDADLWERLERRRDIENVAKHGFNPARFPASFVEAYEALLADDGSTEPDTKVIERLRSAANEVFKKRAPLAKGAKEVVKDLRRIATVALLTKGIDVIQKKRIADAGLAHSFDIIRVVGDKTESEFKDLLSEAGYPPDRSWSVGNSVISDIEPALRLGMRCIWIDAPVWEYEQRRNPPVSRNLMIAHSLGSVVDIISGAEQ